MSEYGMECTTGVGRIVHGHPTKVRPKKHQDNGPGYKKGDPVLDQNGQQIMEIVFGVAFPKAEFEGYIWPTMDAEIKTGYPNGVPPRFSYKYADGDGVDSKGQPYNLREGYAGCYVLTYTQRVNETFGAPPIFKLNDRGTYDQIPGDAIKCGDYVAVKTNFKVNVATGTNTPSVYVNPQGVELVGYGTAIIGAGGVDPNEAFGGQRRALPPGASAVPMQQPGAPGMPMQQAQPAAPQMGMPGAPMAAPAPVMQQPMAAPAPVMQQPMAAPPPPAPVAAPVMARPVDPSHIANPGTPHEQWWNGAAWVPAPQQAQPTLPPPAPDFVQAAAPGMPMQQAQPGAMPGMMPGR